MMSPVVNDLNAQ